MLSYGAMRPKALAARRGAGASHAVAQLDESTTSLLVSDVDDTLLGDDDGLAAFVIFIRSRSDLLLALASGRPCASVRASLASLPTPVHAAAIIGALGTEIELQGEPMVAWAAQFDGWDRAPIDRAMERLGFVPHAAEFQTACKASFTVPAGAPLRAARAAIAATDVPHQVIHSRETNLDVIPSGAGKGAAARYVATALAVPRERLIAAGDSENDTDLLAAAGRGIVVGNARAALRAALDGGHVYLAQRAYAHGILEGLAHWGVAGERNDE